MPGHNIKQLKPSKTGRYKQGYVNPESCKKVFESLRGEPIIYRSSYELTFINWLEKNPGVEGWGSECIKIPYYNIMTGEHHTYYPDYLVKMKNGEGIVVEIKPKDQTQRPKCNHGRVWNEWVKNLSKWKAAKKYCEDRGLKFKILTEETIGKM